MYNVTRNYLFKQLHIKCNPDVVPFDLYSPVCNGYVTECQRLIFVRPVDLILLKTTSNVTVLSQHLTNIPIFPEKY